MADRTRNTATLHVEGRALLAAQLPCPPSLVQVCAQGYFRDSIAVTATPSTCKKCPPGVDNCPRDTRIDNFNLSFAHWRLSNASLAISKCAVARNNVTSCVGGDNGGVEGAGYCLPNHKGPLCQVCDLADGKRRYFSAKAGMCKECPAVGSPLGAAFALAAVALSLAIFIRRVYTRPPKQLTMVGCFWQEKRRITWGPSTLSTPRSD